MFSVGGGSCIPVTHAGLYVLYDAFVLAKYLQVSA